MDGLRKNKLWLCIPFILVFCVDAGVTLMDQPESYWKGDFNSACEGFPLFAWGLAKHPAAFVAVCLTWIVLFSLLIVLLPSRISQILSLALVNGHTWGAMTWFVSRFKLNYHLYLLFFVLTALLYVVAHEKWRRSSISPPS